MAHATLDDLDARTRLVDTDGAAERLGLTAETLRNWRWQGRGPQHVKLGRRVAYRLTDLADWLDSRTRSSTSDDGATG